MNRGRMWDFKGSEIILYDTVMVDTCNYVFLKAYRMYRVNCNVNYEF